MSDSLIIGLSGKKRCGKDHAAELAAEEYGFVNASFATPIKTISKETFNLSHEQLHGNLKETEDPFWGLSPRTIMQRVGTEFAREVFDKDVWVDNFKQRVQSSDEDRVIVSDVRFPNEAYAIQSLGGMVIRIRRPEKEPDLNPVLRALALRFSWVADYLGTEYHPSETALDGFEDFNLRIVNDGDLQDYEFIIDRTIDEITRHAEGRSPGHFTPSRLRRAEGGEVSCKEVGKEMEKLP